MLLQVEGIIREDFLIEAYEILELLCELIAERAVFVYIYHLKQSVLTKMGLCCYVEFIENGTRMSIRYARINLYTYLVCKQNRDTRITRGMHFCC